MSRKSNLRRSAAATPGAKRTAHRKYLKRFLSPGRVPGPDPLVWYIQVCGDPECFCAGKPDTARVLWRDGPADPDSPVPAPPAWWDDLPHPAHEDGLS